MTEVQPQKCVKSKDISTPKTLSTISDAMESDSDDAIMDVLPPACKRGVTIELFANMTLPTERLDGNNATRQESFEDINWQTWSLETEAEKRAEWSKDTKEMQEERKAIQIQNLVDQIERL